MSRGWLFLLVPVIFYLATAAPNIGLGDTALLIEAMDHGYINSGVNNHNLTNAAGHLSMRITPGNMAFRGTMVSVIFGSLAVGILYLLFWSMMGDARPAALAAGAIMVSHSLWWHSALVECYAANAVFMALALSCLVWQERCPDEDRPLLVLFFISGLSIFNHVQLGTIWCGGMVILSWKMVRLWRAGKTPAAARLLAASVAVFLVGFLPYALTFGRDVYRSGNFVATAKAALGGDFQGLMFKGSLVGGLWDVAFLTGMQFPSPFLGLCLVGVVLLVIRWGRSPVGWGLLVMYLVNTWFFALYNTWDKFAFLLPSFLITGFCGAVAVQEWWNLRPFHTRETEARHATSAPAALLGTPSFQEPGAEVFELRSASQNRKGSRILFFGVLLFSIGFPPWFYAQLSIWGREPGFWYSRYNNKHTVNTHDCAEYIANPNKRHFTDVVDFAELLFDRLPKNSIYLDDDGRCYYPLIYFQRYYGKRPDLSIQMINCWGFKNWGASTNGFATLLNDAWKSNRPLFLISLGHPFGGFLEQIPDRGRFIFERFPLDDRRWIYRLRTKDASTGAGSSLPAPLLPVLDSGQKVNLRVIDLQADPGRFISQQEMLGFPGTWFEEDQVFVGFDAPGQRAGIRLKIDRPKAGGLLAGLTMGPDFGDFIIRLDGKEFGKMVSTYDPAVRRAEIHLGACRFEPGEHELEFKVLGKTAQSTGFKLGLDFLQLLP